MVLRGRDIETQRQVYKNKNKTGKAISFFSLCSSSRSSANPEEGTGGLDAPAPHPLENHKRYRFP